MTKNLREPSQTVGNMTRNIFQAVSWYFGPIKQEHCWDFEPMSWEPLEDPSQDEADGQSEDSGQVQPGAREVARLGLGNFKLSEILAHPVSPKRLNIDMISLLW